MGELVAGIIGITGVLVGLFADRLLQRYGKVRCEIEPIELWASPPEGGTVTLRSLPVPAHLVNEAEFELLRYFLNVKLFNEKEVKTGLRDVAITFDTKPPIERTMLDRSTRSRSRASSRSTMDKLEVVNLPSREWVTLSLLDELGWEDARKLTECDRAWLRGYFPDGRQFRQRVPFGS